MLLHNRTLSFVTSTFLSLSVASGCGPEADVADLLDDEDAVEAAAIAPSFENISIEHRTSEVVSNPPFKGP